MHETIELPRYPDVQVTLRSRNRWAVAAAIRIALRRAGKERREIDRFLAEALAGLLSGPNAETVRQRVLAISPEPPGYDKFFLPRWIEILDKAGALSPMVQSTRRISGCSRRRESMRCTSARVS